MGFLSGLTVYARALQSSIRPVWRVRNDRLWEVDALRGVAILMMVVYHVTWDLYGLAGWDIPIYGPFWTVWQRITAGLFIGLVGVSLHLRTQKLEAQGRFSAQPFVVRAAVIFTWGMVITLVTHLFQPEETVRFGILHFIGVAILVGFLFVRRPLLALPVGLLVLFLPRLTSWRHSLFALEWVGMIRAPRPAFDYFPLIPWVGLTLIGLALGAYFFPWARRRVSLPASPVAPVRWLQLAGQNALLLYLIHQPLIVTTLVLLGLVRF